MYGSPRDDAEWGAGFRGGPFFVCLAEEEEEEEEEEAEEAEEEDGLAPREAARRRGIGVWLPRFSCLRGTR